MFLVLSMILQASLLQQCDGNSLQATDVVRHTCFSSKFVIYTNRALSVDLKSLIRNRTI